MEVPKRKGGLMRTELTNELKETYIETAKQLKGSDRRLFMARIVKSLGRGGQRLAARELGWDRKTIRKGRHELDSGIVCIDNFSARGRNPTEVSLPELRQDMRAILDGQSQTDPTFQSQRLYTRLTVKEVRKQLVEKRAIRSSSCLKMKVYVPASTRWAIAYVACARVNPKKSPRNRRHL